jgi:hypothetical protein
VREQLQLIEEHVGWRLEASSTEEQALQRVED